MGIDKAYNLAAFGVANRRVVAHRRRLGFRQVADVQEAAGDDENGDYDNDDRCFSHGASVWEIRTPGSERDGVIARILSVSAGAREGPGRFVGTAPLWYKRSLYFTE